MSHVPEYRRLGNGVVDFHRREAVARRRCAIWGRFQPQAAFRIAAGTLAIVIAAAFVVSVPKALAQAANGHSIFAANDIKWSPAPPSIPAGAQAAVLYGDPGKDGMFALRLKLPKGYAFAPHTHPKPAIVTVISGTFRLGMVETADRTKALSAGSFFGLQPGMAHFAFADEDTVVQFDSNGPWAITYVNPNDDPRRKSQ